MTAGMDLWEFFHGFFYGGQKFLRLFVGWGDLKQGLQMVLRFQKIAPRHFYVPKIIFLETAQEIMRNGNMFFKLHIVWESFVKFFQQAGAIQIKLEGLLNIAKFSMHLCEFFVSNCQAVFELNFIRKCFKEFFFQKVEFFIIRQRLIQITQIKLDIPQELIGNSQFVPEF
ncbi:MAG: hypothetical protein RL386_662 [Bacteroidota bacterium]